MIMTRIADVFPVIDEHGTNLIQKVEQALAVEKREDLKILGQGLLATLRKYQKAWAQNMKGEKRVKPLPRTDSKSSTALDVVEVAPPSKTSANSRPAESTTSRRANASGATPTGPRTASRAVTPPTPEDVSQSEPIKTTSIRGLAAAAARERDEAKEKALASMKRKNGSGDDGMSAQTSQERQSSRTGDYQRPSKIDEEHEADRREDPAQQTTSRRNESRDTPPRSDDRYRAPTRGDDKYPAESKLRRESATVTKEESLRGTPKGTVISRDRSRANSPVPSRPSGGQMHPQRAALLNPQNPIDQDSPRSRSRDEPVRSRDEALRSRGGSMRSRDRRDERGSGRDASRNTGRDAGWDSIRRVPEGPKEVVRVEIKNISFAEREPPKEDRTERRTSDSKAPTERSAGWDDARPANGPEESAIPTGPAADRSKMPVRGAPDSPSGRKRPREEPSQPTPPLPPSGPSAYGDKRLKIDRTHTSSDDTRRDRTYTDDAGEEVKIRGRGGSTFAASASKQERIVDSGWPKGPSAAERERDRIPDESEETRTDLRTRGADALPRDRERPRDERRRERDSERGFARDRDRRAERGGDGGDRDRDVGRSRGGRGRDLLPANPAVGFSDARMADGGFRSADPVPEDRHSNDGRDGHRRRRGKDDRRVRRKGFDDV